MKLKDKNKLLGDWSKASAKDREKFQKMEEESTVNITDSTGATIYNKHTIDSVEPIFREDGSILGYKTKGHFTKV